MTYADLVKATNEAVSARDKKLQILTQNKQAKEEKLGLYSRTEFNDADTTGFATDGKQQVRLAPSGLQSGQWVDTPESPYTTTHRGIYNPVTGKKEIRNLTPEEDAAYKASLMELDNFASGVVPTSKTTMQNLQQHPLSKQDQALYDQYINRGAMPQMTAVGTPGMMDKSGKRQLGDFVNTKGEHLGQRLLDTGAAKLRTSGIGETKLATMSPSERILRTYGGDGNNGVDDLNFLKSLPSGLLNVSSKLAQTGAHGLEASAKFATGGDENVISKQFKQIQQEQEQARKSGLFDKVVGYNPEVVRKMGSQFADDVQKGEYFKAVKNVLSNPEGMATAFLNSAPEMIAMWTPAGLGVMATANANTAIYNLRESAKAQGRDTTLGEEAIATGVSVISTMLDRLGDKVMMGAAKIPASMKETIGKTIASMTPEVKDSVLKTFGAQLGKLGFTGAEFITKAGFEGATEYAQTIGENKSSDVNKLNLQLSDAEHRSGLEAFGVGMGAGSIGAGSHTAPRAIKNVLGVADKGLTALAETTAGRTVKDVFVKKATKRIEEQKAKDEQYASDMEGIKEQYDTKQSADYEARVSEIDAQIEELKDIGKQAYDAGNTKIVEETFDAIQNLEAEKSKMQPMEKFAEDMKKSGVAPEDVAVYTDKAGIADVLTKEDREAGLSMEFSDDTQTKEMSKKKDKLYDPLRANNEMINQVIESGFNEDTISNLKTTNDKSTFVQRLAKNFGFKSDKHTILKEEAANVQEKLKSDTKVQTAMKELSGDTSVAQAMRAISAAVATVRGQTVSEYDIATKAGVKHEGTARALGTVEQVGKAYLNSFGMKLGGKDSVAMAKKYKEIGQKVLNVAEAAGYVEKAYGEFAIQRGMVTEQNAPMKSKDFPRGTTDLTKKEGTFIGEGYKVVGDKGTGRITENSKAEALTQFNKVFNPINEEVPSKYAEADVASQKPISEKHEDIIRNMNEMKFKIKPQFVEFLKELKAMATDGNYDKLLSENANVKRLLGLDKQSTLLTKMSDAGRAINRKGNLTKLLENLDTILDMQKDGFHFSYESAINQRIHVMQTILEFQGDKYMARQILMDDVHEVTDETAKEILIKDLADGLKISEAEVLNPTGVIKEAMDMIGALNGKPMSIRNAVYFANKLGVKSPFKAMSVLYGIYDVSTAVKEGKPIKTGYMVESDATASGAMNTLLNLMSMSGVKELLGKFGIGKDATGAFDPYSHLNDVVAEEKLNAEDQKSFDAIKELVYNSESKMRDLAKSPVMTWIYGQLNKNVARTMGDSIAVDMISAAMTDSKALAWVNKFLKREFSKESIGNMTFEQKQALVDYFTDHVGEVYASKLEKAFPGVKDYRAKMKQIYEALEKTGTWNGDIRSAMDVMLGGKPYKMSLQKLKQMIVGTGNDMTQVDQMMNNETSFNVNLQHSVDAALLLLTMEKVMQKYPDVNVMTVHDAFYSRPDVAAFIMKTYNELTLDVAEKYDFVEVAMMELQDAINKMPKGSDKLAMQNIHDKLNIGVEDSKKTKQKMIQEIRDAGGIKVLGDRNIDLSGVDTKVDETAKKREKTFHQKLTDAFKGENMKEALGNVVSKLEVTGEHAVLKEKVLNMLKYGIKVEKADRYEGGSGVIGLPYKYEKLLDKRLSDAGVAMTPETFIETVAHEMDHALKLNYIENIGKDSIEVRYMQKVLEKMKNNRNVFTGDTKKRVDYILSQEGNRAVSELVAILETEPKTAKEIQAKMTGKGGKLLEYVKALVDKIKTWLDGKTNQQVAEIVEKSMNKDVNLIGIQAALRQIDQSAHVNEVFGTGARAGVVADPYKKEYRSPLEVANDMMARSNSYVSDWMIIYGDVLAEKVGPIAGKLHEDLKGRFKSYRTMVSLIRSGFYDSALGQKIHRDLGFNSDSKKVLLDKLQFVGGEIAKEAQTFLFDMARLDRTLKNTYQKSEMKTLYKVFGKTGIGNISTLENQELFNGLLDGSINAEQAMQMVSEGMSKEVLTELNAVAKYMLTGKTTTGVRNVNVNSTKFDRDRARTYVSVKALVSIPGGLKLLQNMDPKVREQMLEKAMELKHMNEVINEKGMDYTGEFVSMDAGYYGDYDQHYSMDILDTPHEFLYVTKEDMKSSKYTKDAGWKIVKEPTASSLGLVARESYESAGTRGVGLEATRFANGVYVNPEQSIEIKRMLDDLKSDEARQDWLDRNEIVLEGNRYRFLLDEETKVEKLGLVQDPAQSLYRTYVHNFELIQMQSVKDIVLNEGVLKIDTEKEMALLNRSLQQNYEAGLLGERIQIHPFIKVDYDYDSYAELEKKFPYVTRYFETPRNLSTYNDFNRNITFVKKGEGDVLLGYTNASMFGQSDNRDLAKWEQMFKKMIVLAKQKMIVTNPAKLGMDFASNMGVLSMHDMSPGDIYRGMRDAFDDYHEFTKARNEMIRTQMEARIAYAKKDMKKHKELMASIEKQQEGLTKLKFYDAWRSGFIQSYSTDLVIKEFDTITGIQKDIDKFVDRLTLDDEGNPNKLHDAIKKWQAFGGEKFNLDSLFMALSKKLAGKENISNELSELSERLKNKKNEESVARYISEMIGAPSSEVVSYGGAVMVLTDALSKYVLANHLMTQENPTSGKRGARRKYTKEEAYRLAGETFIDYRYNLPKEIKTLSDYGILMFPAFWMRVQKVIAGLIKYHPVSALGGYAIEAALGVQSASIINDALPMKAMSYGGLVYNPLDNIGLESVILAPF